MKPQFQPLFEPFTFANGMSVHNRIVMAPMTTCSSNPDGTVPDDELAYYSRRSAGPGIVVTACVYVSRNGKGFPGEFGADTDEMIPSLKRLADAIKSRGAKAILQIFHGGRSCFPGLVPNDELVSASSIAQQEDGIVPRELTEEEIKSIIADFGEATRRAIEAGFDGVEIHGANGYLLQQFYSPASNVRTDDWGGSVHKRLAFPLYVVEAVKKAAAMAPQPFLVGYRFSPEEPEEEGLTMEHSYHLVNALIEMKLDYLHVSLNDFWSKPRRGEQDSQSRMAWFVEKYSEHIPFIGVGGLTTAEEALEAKNSGVPFIALGRELIMDPDWTEKIKQGNEQDIVTTLSKQDQERLVIPNGLWGAITHAPGWFPITE
ncbi:2,4-dienoyl-CoA reductase [Paenibacillus algorifonticola]|uniref:2,4-dienoyl-CoA reductase n=1 Tax=Paenibacillus algorifonticola TaxID=684063 RepID=A0A1I2IQE7_9BACL|nr:NADH-dependent flavin oxidoreductase [Paenibacillus algorifonticola]SFF44632.1 2,4-dienoyl-CoA reductase [Paenibacillus algorifonticola]